MSTVQRLVIAGGGTGGHIYGGVAIAEEFLKRQNSAKVLFVGSSQGLEVTLVPKAGYELVTINVGKLVGQSVFKRFKTLFQIPWAILQCMRTLKKFSADAVIGVGGYASGPCLIAAKILGIPAFILEQNSVMGLTNRVSALAAKTIFTAFPQPPRGANPKKCIYTGNPVRSTLSPRGPRTTGGQFTVFAFGGSQGSKAINTLLTEAVRIILEKNLIPYLRVIHQTGPTDLERIRSLYASMNHSLDNIEVHPFIHNMQDMYNQADVVIARAGSGTIAELGATKSAAILIPFPHAAANHQEANAVAIEQAGGCLLIRESSATGQLLAEQLVMLSQSSDLLQSLSDKISNFYKADAAVRIVDAIQG